MITMMYIFLWKGGKLLKVEIQKTKQKGKKSSRIMLCLGYEYQKMNNTFIYEATVKVVTPMYNLLEYSDSYSIT